MKYMIPTSVSAPTVVTLTASSILAGSVSGTSTITVNPPSVVSVSPITAQIAGGAAVTVHTSVTYDSAGDVLTPALTISGGTCSTATHNCGTLGSVSTGVITNGTGAYTFSYTPPASLTASEAVTLTVSSTQLLSTPGTATINLTPAPVITISPLTKTVTVGTSATSFNVSVTNDVATETLRAVLLQGGAQCGLICGQAGVVTGTAGSGSYTVTYTPIVIATAPYTVVLQVNSDVPGSTSGSTTITVNPKSVITVSPPAPTVTAGSAQLLFNITVPYDVLGGDSLTAVLTTAGGSCSTTTNNCGTLTAVSAGIITNGAGAYTVGYTPPATISATTVYTLTVTSSIALSTSGVATITVGAPAGTIPRYLLEVNGDSTISSYAVVASTGQLRSVTYIDVSGGFGPVSAAAIHPNGTVIYTVQPMSIAQQLFTYSLSPSGVLTTLGTPITTTNTNYVQVLADPLGRFLWVADNGNNQIVSYPLDPITGALGTQTIAASVTAIDQISADPFGQYVFSRDTSGNIREFSISAGGTLTTVGVSPSSHPTQSGPMQVTPSGKYLYALEDSTSPGFIYGYTISSTGLTSLSGSPFSISNLAGADLQMAIDPTSSFLYAVDSASTTQPIDAFTIATDGSLTPLSETLQAPSNGIASQISIDPSGSYLFLSFGTTEEVWTYAIAQSGVSRGTLTAVNKVRTRSSGFSAQLLSAGSAAVTFTPQSLYVTNSGTNNVSQFSIAPSTGALTSLATPIPLAVTGQPQGIAVTPNGSYAYVADFVNSGIESFGITNGVLSSSGSPVPTGSGPPWLTTDLSGSLLYNVNQTDGTVWKYSIGSTGALTSGAAQTSTNSTAAPRFIATDPTGKFIYTANGGTGTIGEYAIQLPAGGLTSIINSTAAQGTGPAWIAIDPAGRFAYVPYETTSGGGTLGEFGITATTGSLVANGQPYINTGTQPNSAVVEPSGKYIFDSDFMFNKIYSYTIQANGDLAVNSVTPTGFATGTGPVALAVDISGRYLYCVNSGSNDISIYKINLTDGTLSQVGTTTVPTGGTAPTGLAITGTLQ